MIRAATPVFQRRDLLLGSLGLGLSGCAAPSSLGPYPTAANIPNARSGSGINNRFADLALVRPDGVRANLSELRGKIVFAHFWGSWCPPCVREFPVLQELYSLMKDDPRFVFAFINYGEPYAKSVAWANRNNFKVPLYDSQFPESGRPRAYKLADGNWATSAQIEINYYPSTVMLDRNGLVAANWLSDKHKVPNIHWPSMKQAFEHMAEHSAPLAG